MKTVKPSYREAFSQPEFDALVIQFRADFAGNLANQAALMLESGVQHVLGTSAAKWQINPVTGLPTYFDCFPPPEQPVSVKRGFDLKNILKKEESLQYVEALFETNLDNLPEESFLGEDSEGLENLASPWEDLTAAERNPWWNHDLVNSKPAWELSRGQGIIIGHPDTGYIPHFELDDDRIRHDLERNFYDNTPGANNSHERGGNHGLGTATVLLSGMAQQSDTHFVTGIAPEAILVPLRISKAGAPVFFSRRGPRRVGNAVRHAIDIGCHGISMSLAACRRTKLIRENKDIGYSKTPRKGGLSAIFAYLGHIGHLQTTFPTGC
jgi:thermitase